MLTCSGAFDPHFLGSSVSFFCGRLKRTRVLFWDRRTMRLFHSGTRIVDKSKVDLSLLRSNNPRHGTPGCRSPRQELLRC